MHPAAGAAGKLPRGVGRAPDDGSDLVEGHGEHVVQHEGEPLGGSQGLQNDQQRQTDRVGQQRFLLGVASISRPPTRPMRLTVRSGTCASSGSSRRDVRERSMSRQTRPTTVVSHPPRFSTLLVSARLRRSQDSWTASSASLSEPSMR